MNDSIGEHTLGGEMTIVHTRPLDRSCAISGLISEEALASERLGRLTDKVAAALLDANLLSILVPRADGGLGGTGVELFEAAEEIARADNSAGWCGIARNWSVVGPMSNFACGLCCGRIGCGARRPARGPRPGSPG